MTTQGPMIMVHKGWRPFKTQKLGALKSPVSNEDKVDTTPLPFAEPSNARARKGDFEFINTTRPGQTREAGLQGRVRKHARNQRIRGVKPPSLDHLPSSPHSPPSVDKETELTPHVSQPSSIPPPLGNETSLSIFAWPIEMQPRTHLLLSHYLTYASSRMFSLESILESNPLRNPEWFQYAATDAAMMHAMLYSGSLYMCLFDQGTWGGDVVFHQMRTVGILGERLRGKGRGKGGGLRFEREDEVDIEDSTVGAISCLALGEAVMGNKEMWSMHMQGLKQVLSIKGRLGGLSPLMKAKLRRSDVTGAMDYGAIPYLNIERCSTIPIWSILPLHKIQTTMQAITSILTKCSIKSSLIATMINLSLFSQTIRLAKLTPGIKLDPITFSEDLYAIERDLLFASNEQQIHLLVYDLLVSNALRVGALLYVKSILHEFPHSVIGPSILLSQLQELLSQVLLDFTTTPATKDVLRWLGMIGAMLAQTEDVRDWFLGFLQGKFGIDGFDGESCHFFTRDSILKDLLSLENMWDVRMDVDQVWRRLGRASLEGS